MATQGCCTTEAVGATFAPVQLRQFFASCFRDNVVAAALVACGEAGGAKCALGQHFLELFSRGHGNVVLVVLS